MTVYAFIPARGGSKRVPGKNWEPMLSGRSLVDIAIQCARLADVDRIVVSTDVAVDMTDPDVELHRRKPQHADDHAQIEDAILDWGKGANLQPHDTIVLLQPTSPLRRPSTVRRCIAHAPVSPTATVTLCRRWPFQSVLTESHGEDTGIGVAYSSPERPRSQDIKARAEENGAVYAFSWRILLDIGRRIGTQYRAIVTPWWEAFEIDTPEDVEVVKALWPAFGGRS